MPIKTIKCTLQAEPAADQDVNIHVMVDNVSVFNQTVPAAGPVALHEVDPSESFTFDFDVAASANVGDTQTHTMSISAANGSAKIENITCNFTATVEQAGNVWNFVPGDANTFVICNVVSQPLWNGEPILSRYDITYNNGPEQLTGPGEILILDGEAAEFDLALPLFNDSAPSV